MGRILAPHREQEGWVYVRVCKRFPRAFGGYTPEWIGWVEWPGEFEPEINRYCDEVPNARIISSRKAEEAVETWEYLQRCAEEGLTATLYSIGSWVVGEWAYADGKYETFSNGCTTIREAYHRYKNRA